MLSLRLSSAEEPFDWRFSAVTAECQSPGFHFGWRHRSDLILEKRLAAPPDPPVVSGGFREFEFEEVEVEAIVARDYVLRAGEGTAR